MSSAEPAQALTPEPDDIIKTLTHLHPPRTVFEVCLINPQIKKHRAWGNEFAVGKKHIIAGWFDDPVKAAEIIRQLDEQVKPAGVYVTLNPCNPALLGRANNRLKANAGRTTDKDINRLCHLLIDIDPERPAGVSSSEVEKAAAKAVMDAVYNYLKDIGWREPLRGDSANGGHLIYLLDLENNPDNVALIKAVLHVLDAQFSNDQAKIDVKVYNPARISKVYGTTARKGDSTHDRPHRKAAILSMPDHQQPVPFELLQALAAETLAITKPTRSTTNHQYGQRLNVESYLNKYGVPIKEIKQHGNSTLYVLETCVFDENHTGGEAAIGQTSEGKLFYQCFHDSCQGHTWHEARAIISGNDPLFPEIAGGIIKQWAEPEPLNPVSLTEAANFPVESLPEIIEKAVTEYQAFGQQPMAMIASSALAMVSLVTQCHADVERATNLRGPISLNFLQQAESGERKTAADQTFSTGARSWLREQQLEAEDLKLIGMAIQKSWEATEAGLLHDIKKCKDHDKKKVLEEDLREHYKDKPDPVNIPEMFLSDCNPASLIRDMSENPLYGMAIWADEGGLVIGGDGGRDDNITSFIALLNVLWDGSPVSQRRIGGNRTVNGKRLTVNIMAQKQVIQKLITGQSGLARGMGLLARFLLCAPPSTIGTRFFRESGPMNSVKLFNERVKTLLEQKPQTDDNGQLDPPVLTLSKAAFDLWREFFDDVERSMAPHGDLETVKDVASKTAENAARLAGCFHVFCNSSISINSESSMPLKTTLIDVKTMKSACRIAMYYLSEARRIFGCMDTPPEIIDAEKLLSWWRTRRDDKRLLPKGEIRREGPLRDTQRLNAALTVLEQSGHIEQEPIQGTKGINIKINPLAFGEDHG